MKPGHIKWELGHIKWELGHIKWELGHMKGELTSQDYDHEKCNEQDLQPLNPYLKKSSGLVNT